MTSLLCCLPTCTEPAEVVYLGFSLCHDHIQDAEDVLMSFTGPDDEVLPAWYVVLEDMHERPATADSV